MLGMKADWLYEPRPRHFVLNDYEGAEARWCSGCGDHAVLNAVQRLARDEQIAPEKMVNVSGIGCSGRFSHYMKTYGFHGLHGRALPVACGVKSRRPDLKVFVSTGDGDCCSIGTGHWIHAIRYNMDMVIMLFDNHIYGLTKEQTSPTTNKGATSKTHPRGAFLGAMNPISVTLGITNASFVAQTVDWNPPHLYETIKAGYRHKGTAFIRIFQRCPHFTSSVFDAYQKDPSLIQLMTHKEGIPLDDAVLKMFKNRVEHDPSNLVEAHDLANNNEQLPIGLFYRNADADRYDEYSAQGMGKTNAEKLEALEKELDRFSV
ncbi:thiamine pyrophosphate-dependent enzyme [Deltaproteobacteria bacterium TL4]